MNNSKNKIEKQWSVIWLDGRYELHFNKYNSHKELIKDIDRIKDLALPGDEENIVIYRPESGMTYNTYMKALDNFNI
ncbi:MAG: hypothetical protein ACOCRK_11815 [bacterium]